MLKGARFTLVVSVVSAISLGTEADPRFSSARQSVVPYTATPHAAVRSCAGLATMALEDVTLKATLVPAADGIPEHCEIIANVRAETGVYIGLPTRWNGRLWMIGNGGFAGGSVERHTGNVADDTAPRRTGAINSGLIHGFATVYTNGGHSKGNSLDGSFAYDRPDLLEDLAYGAVHRGILLAKRAAEFYFGMMPQYSYFEGCSTGGRQGLMAATRYPDDFDGIASSAPTLRWADIMIKARWNRMTLDAVPSLTQERLSRVFQAVLRKCDDLDGVRDGLIADPRQCDFDPERDLSSCDGEKEGDCFTDAERRALTAIRMGPPIEGEYPLPQYWDTLSPSTAERWLANRDGSPLALTLMAQSFFKYAAFFPDQDPAYDWHSFDFERDPARMAVFNKMMNPEPDFSAFRDRGGKILGFWGWADTALNPEMGIAFYNQILASLGPEQTHDFYRLFFVPGVAHCAHGYGPDEIDVMSPLIEWVEVGRRPERLPASKTIDGKRIYDRAYCPFPQTTAYVSGDPERPENWTCAAD